MKIIDYGKDTLKLNFSDAFTRQLRPIHLPRIYFLPYIFLNFWREFNHFIGRKSYHDIRHIIISQRDKGDQLKLLLLLSEFCLFYNFFLRKSPALELIVSIAAPILQPRILHCWVDQLIKFAFLNSSFGNESCEHRCVVMQNPQFSTHFPSALVVG